MLQVGGQHVCLVEKDFFQERKNLAVHGRFLVCHLEGGKKLFPGVVAGIFHQPHFIDLFIGAGAGHGDVKIFGLSLIQITVPVDPAAFDEIYIIVNNEGVRTGDQLPVAQIWEKIRLHD